MATVVGCCGDCGGRLLWPSMAIVGYGRLLSAVAISSAMVGCIRSPAHPYAGSVSARRRGTQRIYGIYGPNNTVYRIYGVLSRKAVYHIPYIVPYPSPTLQASMAKRDFLYEQLHCFVGTEQTLH
jgi:hypothetical protein